MARSGTIEPDVELSEDIGSDAEIDRMRTILGQDRQAPLTKTKPFIPNPSEPRRLQNFGVFQQLLPQVRENSETGPEYRENLKRVLEALFKREYGAIPNEEEWKELESTIQIEVDRYMLKQRSENTHFEADAEVPLDLTVPPDSGLKRMQQDRRNELREYEDEFMRNK